MSIHGWWKAILDKQYIIHVRAKFDQMGENRYQAKTSHYHCRIAPKDVVCVHLRGTEPRQHSYSNYGSGAEPFKTRCKIWSARDLNSRLY